MSWKYLGAFIRIKIVPSVARRFLPTRFLGILQRWTREIDCMRQHIPTPVRTNDVGPHVRSAQSR
jgi:hypothetical protein